MSRKLGFLAAAAIAAVAATTLGYALQAEASVRSQLAEQKRSVADLKQRIATLETQARSQPDWPAIATEVEASVVTIETDAGLGSGWVAHSDATGSDLVTNFHVIAGAWQAGKANVTVRRGDETSTGTIVRADTSDDLAVVHVKERFPALASATQRP